MIIELKQKHSRIEAEAHEKFKTMAMRCGFAVIPKHRWVAWGVDGPVLPRFYSDRPRDGSWINFAETIDQLYQLSE